MARRLLRLARDRRGGVLVEAALVFPLLFATIFGSIELGKLLWSKMAMDYAVQEAARCADVRKDICGTPAQVAAYVRAKALPLDVPLSGIQVNYPACGIEVIADLQYTYTVGSYIFTKPGPMRAYTCRAPQP